MFINSKIARGIWAIVFGMVMLSGCLVVDDSTGGGNEEEEVVNLVLNGSFEEEDPVNSGLPAYWTRAKDGAGSCEWVTDEAHSDSHSVKVSAATDSKAEWNSVWSELPSSVTQLDVSAWIKASDVVVGPQNWQNLRFSIAFRDAGGQAVGNRDMVTTTGTFGWDQYQNIVDVPEGAAEFRLFFGLRTCTGTAWLDDVLVEAAD